MGIKPDDQKSSGEVASDLPSLSPFLNPKDCGNFKAPPYYFLFLSLCPGSSKTSMANSGHFLIHGQFLLAVLGMSECDQNIP